jgi:hypothetical protein
MVKFCFLDAKKMKTKKIFFILVNGFLAIASFFLIGEICFRIFRGPPNPSSEIAQKKVMYLVEPNTIKHKKSSVEGEFAYAYHINQYGYRGANFTMPKSPKVLRIMAMGDSMTFGVGANDDETAPYYLEKQLNAKGLPVEVINAGAGHAGTIKHYLNLKNFHLKYQPDLVLLLFDLTDLMDDWYVERHAMYNKDGEIEGMHPLYVNGRRDWWLTTTYYSSFCKYIHNKIVRTYRKWRLLGINNGRNLILSIPMNFPMRLFCSMIICFL